MKKKLEELKKIPIDQFCINQLGYTPDKSKDSKLWRVLVSPQGFKIVTESIPKENGDYLFFSPERDVRGSIINLLVQLHGYQIIDILIEFCGTNMPQYLPPVYNEINYDNSTESVKKLYINYLERCTNSGHNYLTMRGISVEVINYFKIPVAERELFLPLYVLEGGKWKVSTAISFIFNCYNEKKRYFLKRKNGFKKGGSYSMLTPQKRAPEYYDTLFVFESPVDALSYIQLFPHERDGIFVSFCGGLGSGFKHQLLTLLEKLDISQVILCMDNDAAGYKFVADLKSIIFGCEIIVKYPSKKDWNDQLIASQASPKN